MTNKSVKDYYAILGIGPGASLEEIRQAYRRQARAYHPDLSSDPRAEERFKEVNEAYEVLANSERRQAYDYFTADGTRDTSADRPDVSHSVEEPGSTETEPTPTSQRDAVETPVNTSQISASGEKKTPTSQQRSAKKLYPPTWAMLLIVLGACIILSVGVGALLSLRSDQPRGGAQAVDVTKLTTFTSPPPIPDDLTVLQEDDQPIRTVAPVQLDFAGASFPITAVLPEQGRWPIPADEENLALWIHGTLINYVVGLPYASTSEALLAGLSGEARIVLTLRNGARLTFTSPQVKYVDVDDRSPLAQTRPGLTLLLLGGDQASRLVVSARYLPEAELPPDQQQVEGLRLRVPQADLIEDETPPQAWFYVIEFEITNTTQSPIDPTFFDMVLEDGRTQRYVLNEEATRRGGSGRLTAPIEPGATVNANAGYVIPRDATPPMVWIFRSDPTASAAVRFVLDFTPPLPAPAQPDVELYEVFLDRARNVVVIAGTVYNTGESDLQATTELIALTSSQGQSNLVASAPPLPWNVSPGSYQDLELQFTAPLDSDTALLDVLGFTFEIEGLIP